LKTDKSYMQSTDFINPFFKDISGIENVRMYSYNELRKATNDFRPGN